MLDDKWAIGLWETTLIKFRYEGEIWSANIHPLPPLLCAHGGFLSYAAPIAEVTEEIQTSIQLFWINFHVFDSPPCQFLKDSSHHYVDFTNKILLKWSHITDIIPDPQNIINVGWRSVADTERPPACRERLWRSKCVAACVLSNTTLNSEIMKV